MAPLVRGNERTLQRLTSGTDCTSLQSRILVGLLRLFRVKKRMASAGAVQHRVRRLALRPVLFGPTGLGRGVEVTRKDVAGWPIYHTAPAAHCEGCNIVVFLHGGGYINEIVRAHWRIVGYFTRTAEVRCIVPIYPLAPHNTAEEVVPAMGELLRKILQDAGAVKVTVVGNSAGAALGLAAAQWLRDRGHTQPSRLVLISPGGDFSVSRPEQVPIAARDPVNDIPGVREVGRLFAGDFDIAHPYVSPLNGDFRGLAPIIIFSGTLDLFYPDCVDMAAKASAAGVAVELHLKQGQPHNYAGMPTPEGREARTTILRSVA
ncbi:alpha/beta fold hydrolase [Mesorhizobium sp. ISC11]|uniref:alpha/beta fold hydrolase n=1 Tax=Mesorhizobium sp. ISC11 TaxID=3076428 RepID=UPI00301D7C17